MLSGDPTSKTIPALLGAVPDCDLSIPRLDVWLAACSAASWAWGVMDCCQFAGGWVHWRTGRDPLVAHRYDSVASAKRVILRSGGLFNVVNDGLKAIGIEQTNSIEHGDVALVKAEVRSEHHIAGHAVVISDGRWFIGKEPDGLSYSSDLEVIAAWRVGAA